MKKSCQCRSKKKFKRLIKVDTHNAFFLQLCPSGTNCAAPAGDMNHVKVSKIEEAKQDVDSK